MKADSTLKKRPRASAGVAATRWQGEIQGIHRGLVYGWALDTANPDARVVLEILRGSDTLGTVVADLARTDLADAFAAALGAPPTDLCHGFVADIGAGKGGALVTAVVANTGAALAGAVRPDQAPTPPAAATSAVFGDGGLRLHGWAYDGSNEQRVLTVRAFVGHALAGETAASHEHPALRSYAVGRHGFTLDLPLALADGMVHSVRVVDDDGAELNGSPLAVCCFAGGARALLQDAGGSLLDSVVEGYERYLPRSLGMAQYRQWAAMFGPPAPARDPQLKVALLFTAHASEALMRASAASVQAQQGVHVTLMAPGGGDFAAMLGAALEAGCDVIGCIRPGDTLAPRALATALQGFAHASAELVYTDSDHAGAPWFKPAWNADYALASGYPLELMLVRAAAVRDAAARAGLPASQAAFAWQALGAGMAKGMRAIVHVPHVLYHYNSPLDQAEKEARAHAAQQALAIVEPAATLSQLDGAPPEPLFRPMRVQRKLTRRERATKVSIVIPTRDRVELLERCIDTLGKWTDWPDLEIIVIDNGSTEATTRAWFRKVAKQGVVVMPMPGPFNFAALNNRAIAAAAGDIIGLVNNDIEALHAGWLDEIVGQLLRPGVGAVGAKLLWPNGMVQHGGVLLGVGNAAGHFGNRLADADWGDHGRNQLVQQLSGVTAACLFLRKSDYFAVGGMDEAAFPVAFNDVDLCLKLRAAGKTITWTPHAVMLHAESASRGHEDTPQKIARSQRELDQLRRRWGPVLLRDPAYHPSLNLDAHSHAFGGLALPPRERSPRFGTLDNTLP